MLVYYSTASRNTERFVLKLDRPNMRFPCEPQGRYILVTPTYADHTGEHAVPKPVIMFLNRYRHGLVGIVGTGNRNFGSMFCLAADVIAHKTGKPVLHKLEISGTDEDVRKVGEAYDYFVQQGKLPAMPNGEAMVR